MKLDAFRAAGRRFGIAMVALALVACAASPVLATPFEIQSLTAEFANPVPEALATIVNTGNPVTIRWGSQTRQSGYDFESIVPPEIAGTAPDGPFLLGYFTHHNFVIPSGTSITSTELILTFALDLDGTLFSPVFTYLLDHEETPNSIPCAYPSDTPCADRVTISSPSGGNQFTVGLTVFTLNLAFSPDGGNTFSNQYITQENLANTAGLYGFLETSIIPEIIPEPGTWTLMGLGLAGVAIGGWRRRRAN
jgi:hypothetical protein